MNTARGNTNSLIHWLPQLRYRSTERPIVPSDVCARYPDLKSDFVLLDKELMPAFLRFDREAQIAQHEFRLEQMVLIFGGTVTAALGIIQGALHEAQWPGLLETIMAAFLGFLAFRARAQKKQEHYFDNRLKAEALRGEFFLFLGRIGDYADDEDRLRHLVEQVGLIETGAKKVET